MIAVATASLPTRSPILGSSLDITVASSQPLLPSQSLDCHRCQRHRSLAPWPYIAGKRILPPSLPPPPPPLLVLSRYRPGDPGLLLALVTSNAAARSLLGPALQASSLSLSLPLSLCLSVSLALPPSLSARVTAVARSSSHCHCYTNGGESWGSGQRFWGSGQRLGALRRLRLLRRRLQGVLRSRRAVENVVTVARH